MQRAEVLLTYLKEALKRGESVIAALAESPAVALLFHRISLSNHNRSYHLFACFILSLFAFNFPKFHGIKVKN